MIDRPPQEADEERDCAGCARCSTKPCRIGRRVSEQHERITVTRNGEAQFVLVSVDDLEGLEITLEVLSDEGTIGRIAESLASLESGDPGVTVAQLRADLARRRAGA